MRKAGLIGASHRRGGPVTTRRDQRARPAPDLVDRNFVAEAPNRLWVADITYLPTADGFLYLAVVLDAFSRRIVGWAMANHLRSDLVLDALAMAVGQRKPRDVIHHSDQGAHYTSLTFGNRCQQAGQASVAGLGRRRLRQRPSRALGPRPQSFFAVSGKGSASSRPKAGRLQESRGMCGHAELALAGIGSRGAAVAGRELLLHPRMRVARPPSLSLAGRGADGLLQLHRRPLQPPAPALAARLPLARRPRAGDQTRTINRTPAQPSPLTVHQTRASPIPVHGRSLLPGLFFFLGLTNG